jgi:alpha-1,6-mannosyltransferase
MHLVDTTLFYSPASGGVRRYLSAKHGWYSHGSWQHSLLVPGDTTALHPGGVSTIKGAIVPWTFNYRLPLHLRKWAQLLDALQPDVIESGDAFHPAWATLRVARQRGIPAIAFFHSHLPRLVGMRFGAMASRLAGQYLRSLYERFDMVCAPSRIMCDYLRSLGLSRVTLQPQGVDVDVFHPSRRSHTLRGGLGLAENVRLLAYAGRFSGEKNIPVLLAAFSRLGAD